MDAFSNIAIEKKVLGSMIFADDVLREVYPTIEEEMFSLSQHRIVFQAIQQMVKSNISVDMITLANTLKSHNVLDAIGGVTFINDLTSRITSFAHIQTDILLLKEYQKKRQLLTICKTTLSRLEYGEDVFDILDKHVERLNEVYVDGDNGEHIITTQQAVLQVVEQMDHNRSNDKVLTGIPTGFYFFDKKTGGLQAGNLIVIAGESSQGKTSLALSITYNATRQGYSGAYYSLEMGSKELVARLMAMNLNRENIKPSDLLYKRLDDDTYSFVLNNANNISNCQIYFDERVNSNLSTIVRSIKILKAKYNIQFAVVDYLQIMTAFTKQNKESELAEIARELKNVAVKERIPIILLSQLARDRINPEPTNSRLRGSGQIEEASDMVLLVYRPEVYGLQYTEDGLQDKDTHGTALIKVSKGRNTGIFNFLVGFNADHTRFYDLREKSSSDPITPNLNFYENSNNEEEF